MTGQVSEENIVAIVGYVVGKLRASKSGESVNCRMKDEQNDNFHILVVRKPHETEQDGIVVDMVPPSRQAWRGEL